MIYQTVTETGFISAFAAAGRADQFTVPARAVLFEYYESLAEDTGEDIELDVIAICCDWHEMTLDELRAEYPDQLEGARDFYEAIEALRDCMEVLSVYDTETALVQTCA